MSIDFPSIPHLVLITAGEPKRVPLEQDGTLLIGASASCKLQLAGQDVRALHCVVVQKDGCADLRDWNTGCTFLNGKAVIAPAPLQHGDQINIAGQEISVVMPSHQSHTLPSEAIIPASPQGEADLQAELQRSQLRQRELESQLSQMEAKVGQSQTPAPVVPVEIVVALKNQVETLLVELKASQQSVAELKANQGSIPQMTGSIA